MMSHFNPSSNPFFYRSFKSVRTLFFGLCLLWGGSACCASALPSAQDANPLEFSSELPLEINADNGIVCEKEKNICTASSHVVAVHGDSVVTCDTLVAYFRKGEKEGSELWKVEARGNVVLHSLTGHRKAWAQQGVYTLEDEHLVLTGGNLKLEVDDLEVTCQDSLEYFKAQQSALARGNVVAVKEDQVIKGDTLRAYFRENKDKKNELWKLEGAGDVSIQSEKENFKAFAQDAVYTPQDGYALLTGGDLKLEVDDLTVTALDSLEYFKDKGIAFARGNAAAFKENRLIKGKTLKAYFGENLEGKRSIKEIEAFKSVLISTDTEISTGDYGHYFKDTERAFLDGNVKITRKDGQMEGNHAEVKLDTGVSKMVNHPSINSRGKDRRVHVLLLPQNKKTL